jgi:hypothetical protein
MTGRPDPSPESHRYDAEPIWTGMGPSAEMEATNIQQLLEASGIDAFVNGFSQIPSVEFEILVARENVAKARQVIADALASGPSAAEEAERDTEAP